MTAPSFGTSDEFRIVSHTFDSWNVQVRIDVAELVDQKSLLKHLRAIKQRIAAAEQLHESCIVFDGTVSKTRTDDVVDVIVRIKKVPLEKGNPTVSCKDGIATDGTRYSRMIASLDIYYLDLFDRLVTVPRVMQAILDAGIPADLIQRDAIAEKVQEVLDNQSPLKNIPLAQGSFPDAGRDAELEFYFHASADPEHPDARYSSRKVRCGDILCRKRPSTVGKTPGRNTVGDSLPPRAGRDITLTAETGAALSLDGNQATAAADGVVFITRTMQRVALPQGAREFLQTVSVKVSPLLTVKGDQVLDIATSQTVEVVGNLSMGSRILTDCEVYVSGDVEAGSLIEALDDITVEGEVHGAELNGESNVVLHKSVRESSLVSARGHVHVRGAAVRSKLIGNTVSAESAAGCHILARNGVTLGRIDSDEKNVLSTICVGMGDFFRQRLQDNEEFIKKARENILRIELLFSREIVEEVKTTNVQAMLRRVLAQNRSRKDLKYRRCIDAYRKIMESIPPTKALVLWKERENAELRQRIDERSGDKGSVVIVREQIAAPALINVDGVEATVAPVTGPVAIRADDNGGLVVTPATV